MPWGGRFKGKLYGFPIGGRCVINRECKINPIQKFYKNIDDNITQYVGIASDEPKRLARLKDNQISLLEKYGYTEKMAFEKCREYGLISPIYGSSSRGGCWFCPNAKYPSFLEFRRKHGDLWGELETLSKTPNLCSYGFKYGKTFQYVNDKLDAMENQLTLF